MVTSTLYVVATPIGNLEDVTLRALRILKEADLIAAEDTRVTRKLLSHYDIHTLAISYHSHSRLTRVQEIMAALLEGKSVALVSDAGTPGISDPGHELIVECVQAGIAVEAIPGPSAAITALVLSALPTARFAFEGFVPRKESERRAVLRALRSETRTTCFYEAPTRLLKTLKSIEQELGERPIAVVREATKMFEETFRGTASEAIEHFSQREVRGEIVIVIAGQSDEEARETRPDEQAIEGRLRELSASGMSERDAVRQCSTELGAPRRDVYAIALRMKAPREPQA